MDILTRLEELHDVGVALSAEQDIDALLEMILNAAKRITNADAGTLYRVTPDGKHLRFEIVRTDSLGIALGGPSAEPIAGRFPDIPLVLGGGEHNNKMIAAYAANTGATINVPDAYSAVGFDFSGTKRFDAYTGYRSRSFLTVPMRNHEGRTIGVLQLINVKGPNGPIEPFSAADQRLVESLASQAAVALTNRQLVEQLEQLFESFIRMINGAIDEKSPHTSKHCQRVPELTMMLAEAVNATQEGPLASFALDDADLYELRIAAMLHDCGKIATPVHVVDKATKLQTIHDRIELIAARFEIVRAQRTARSLQRALGGAPLAELELAQKQWEQKLDEDLLFLRRANLGSERMSDADQARVREIAEQYRWRDAHGMMHSVMTEEEQENLLIRAGTLTEAERKIINQHIVATVRMLNELSWPEHLKNVPEYAGGHHERMDGKGYPSGLSREQMSVQARLMGIADIFEALTATDRPYKKPMKVSEALSILERFKHNGHIDPDLDEVFVSKGVYRQYASRFLSPEQQDC